MNNEPAVAAKEEKTLCLPENTNDSGYSAINYNQGNSLYFNAKCTNNYQSLYGISCFGFAIHVERIYNIPDALSAIQLALN